MKFEVCKNLRNVYALNLVVMTTWKSLNIIIINT